MTLTLHIDVQKSEMVKIFLVSVCSKTRRGDVRSWRPPPSTCAITCPRFQRRETWKLPWSQRQRKSSRHPSLSLYPVCSYERARQRKLVFLSLCTLYQACVKKDNLFCLPLTQSTMASSRAFSIAGPTLWNALPQHLRYISDLATSRRRWNAHLFVQNHGPRLHC